MKKVVAVIGGSASGIYFSLLLKKKHPEYDVLIIEKENKLGKKLLATGNGHCNCLNANLDKSNFNKSPFVDDVFSKYSLEDCLSFFNSLGIQLVTKKDGLIYPASYSAATFVDLLTLNLEKEGIRVLINCRLIDYSSNKIKITREGKIEEIPIYYVVFATGAKSGRNLGSDGNLISTLESHGYKFNEFVPGLCPIKVKENLSSIEGCRLQGTVKVINSNNKEIFSEAGEVLFKKDGLSGIVIFNASRILAKEKSACRIVFRPEFDVNKDQLLANLKASYAILENRFLESLFEKRISEYLFKKASNLGYFKEKCVNFEGILSLISEFNFPYISNYGFQDSQVSIGGITNEFVDLNLHSKIEPNVCFVGEVLDVDGKCGGYNLSWALMSAMRASDSF